MITCTYASHLMIAALALVLRTSFVQCWSIQIPTNSLKTRSRRIVSMNDSRIARHNSKDSEVGNGKPTRVYFDISIGEEGIGRLVFNLGSDHLLPKHSENLVKLCSGDLRPIDPACSYIKCSFKHSPQFVETMPQYRWAHVLDGRGRNAVGRATDRITDPEGMKKCTHNLYGGVYYGLKYDESLGQNGVVLTVPLVGPYRGSTSFSIVRVGESPQEWQEKLLLNSAVLGWLESGIEVLHTMARQNRAPPLVTGSGKL